MKLSNSQKNQIYNKTMIVDDYEWVPCINHVLEALGYEDSLEHDENYEVVKWSGTNPLIKDEKIRRAVRAWAELSGVDKCHFEHDDGSFAGKWYGISLPTSKYGEDIESGFYTIAELCGEDKE